MSKPEIIIASEVGACFGVRQALALLDQTVQDNLSGNPIYLLGQIIHNSAVIAQYQACGVQVIDIEHDNNTALSGLKNSTVVVRTHGVDPKLINILMTNGNTIIDATCPHVQAAQQLAVDFATKYGKVVIIGENGHPEVTGMSGFIRAAGGKAIIVAHRADFARQSAELNLADNKFGLIAQTTQRQQNVDDILSLFDEQKLEYEYANTLCAATAAIQRHSIELAKTVDLMLVVGGKNSANTRHLAQSCQEHCSATYQIEDSSEIDPTWLNTTTVATIGITGGASTPLNQLNDVADYLVVTRRCGGQIDTQGLGSF